LAGRERPLPPFPPSDAKGNRPALEYIQVTIARDIIKERRALGPSQLQLAKLAGLRQETLSRLESRKHSPTIRTAEKIDRALKHYASSRKNHAERELADFPVRFSKRKGAWLDGIRLPYSNSL
jgi:transcriptional regulator with XRE-family HTH domain